MMFKRIYKLFCVTVLALPLNSLAFEGLKAVELPIGGDVTIPGQYPVLVQSSEEVTLTAHDTPQSLVMSNHDKKNTSVINLYASKEKTTRKITLAPNSNKIYNLDKKNKSVRLRVMQGSVQINSLNPIKVQR